MKAFSILFAISFCVLSPLHVVYADGFSRGTQKNASSTKVQPIKWETLSPEAQKILQPLQGSWDTLTPKVHRHLVYVAQRYPTLSPIQQQRIQQRLEGWVALSPEQRKKARLNFLRIQSLPKAKQTEIRQQLKARHPAEELSHPLK